MLLELSPRIRFETMVNGDGRKRRQLTPEEKWQLFLDVTSQRGARNRPLLTFLCIGFYSGGAAGPR